MRGRLRSDHVEARRSSVRTASRWLLSALYLIAGIAHLTRPSGFIAITPQWVPYPADVIAFTGIAEVAGAIGLHIPQLRKAAGVGLALYALCVWPANLNHAINDIPLNGVHLGWWYHGPRLVLQPVIIWWALWAGAAIEWPFGGKAATRPYR
ncbi:MAG TPA: DoxX family protein [Sphingobium sp.]|nr:DoxX family protein [Sphingobium sp.]